jgi:phosphatidylglycerol lysyltransferase
VTLGEDARVFLPHFSLESSGRRTVRTTMAHLDRVGVRIRVEMPAAVPALLPALSVVSEAWLAERGAAEQGFAVSRFDERYVSGCLVLVAGSGSSVDAFATLWSLPGRQTLRLDMLRQRPGAPRGIAEGMIAWLLVWARQHGYTWCDLGMAPPVRSERPELAPFWRRRLPVTPSTGDLRATVRAMRDDRQKFDPVWEPRYLVYPGGAALGGVLADVTALIEHPRGLR